MLPARTVWVNTRATYSLRAASEADFTWLRHLHHTAMRESVEQIWGWDDARQDAYFRAHFDPTRLQIIQCEGRDIGVLRVEERGDELFLADIQIDPLEQGRGIGSAVIHDLQAQAAAKGIPMALQVNRANRARRLYERLGFIVTDETETHYKMRWISREQGSS